jgi:hypothetical protein
MPHDPPIDPTFDVHTSIEFPAEGVTTSADVTKVGPALYRLESAPICIESITFRDIFEAEELDETTLRFLRLVERSHWQTFDFLLARETFDRENTRRVLQRVEDMGGHWERVFGGLLFICLPPGIDWNPTLDLLG